MSLKKIYKLLDDNIIILLSIFFIVAVAAMFRSLDVARLILMLAGAIYFIKSLHNQTQKFDMDIKQKKVDEITLQIDQLEKSYIEVGKIQKEDNEARNNLANEIYLLGERIFKFIEFHDYLFKFKDSDMKVFQKLYSFVSDNNFSRALDKSAVFSIILDARTILWSKIGKK